MGKPAAIYERRSSRFGSPDGELVYIFQRYFPGSIFGEQNKARQAGFIDHYRENVLIIGFLQILLFVLHRHGGFIEW